MDKEIELSYCEFQDIVLVCFDTDGYKYFMSSPLGFGLQELFEFLSISPRTSTVSSVETIDSERSREIWEGLVELNFERANDLESSANYKYRDDSITVYKIRDKTTKMYSQGGQAGGRWLWSKKGKTWNQLNHIQSHITQLDNGTTNDGIPEEYTNAELVELGELSARDMTDFQDIKKGNK